MARWQGGGGEEGRGGCGSFISDTAPRTAPTR